MRNRKYLIRLIGILTIGVLLVKMTTQFKHSSFMFDLIIFGILSLIGIIIFIWSLFIDLKKFRNERKIFSLLPLGVGIIFTAIIWILNVRINSSFEKPTLVRVFYNGDFNGTGIDFKTDGTYIFDNSAIGMSNYLYGTYEISGNTIILDNSFLDNIVVTNQLEIRPKVLEYSDKTEVENYVYQVDKEGNLLRNETEFRLVVDNRK